MEIPTSHIRHRRDVPNWKIGIKPSRLSVPLREERRAFQKFYLFVCFLYYALFVFSATLNSSKKEHENHYREWWEVYGKCYFQTISNL